MRRLLDSNVGYAVGRRMAEGKTPTVRVLRTLSVAQLDALERALNERGKRFPSDLMSQLKREARRRQL